MKEHRKIFRENAILEFGLGNKAAPFPWGWVILYAFVGIIIQTFSRQGYLQPHFLLYLVAILAVTQFSWTILTSVEKEVLLVIVPIGLQHTVIYRYNGSKNSTFIPWHNVRDVVINEAITLHRVVFYLAVLVNDSENEEVKVIPLFQHTKPRLAQVIETYRAIQEVIQSQRFVSPS